MASVRCTHSFKYVFAISVLDFFRANIAEDFVLILDYMTTLSEHHNKDIKRAVYRALEAFLQEVAAYIVQEGKAEKKTVAIFSALLKRFKQAMSEVFH